MISHPHKLIVIHTPRCGGTSLEEALTDATGHHSTASWYAENHPEAWASYRKIAIWRDPVKRFDSLWRYWSNLKFQSWGRHEHIFKRLRAAWMFRALVGQDINEALRLLPALQAAEWTHTHFLPQTYFIDRPDIEILPITQAHEEIAGLIDRDIPHLNRGKGASGPNGNWQAQVAEAYAEDYNLLPQ
jgi:hypothetical protein